MIGSNRKTRSSIRGTTRHGVTLCWRLEKVGKIKDRGYMDLIYSGFVKYVYMKKG
jgi:hypothetical protein